MARNIELKARAGDFPMQKELALAMATGPAQVLQQRDVFFECPKGRLKLRYEGNSGHLISYQRPDIEGPKLSQYQVYTTAQAENLQACLQAVLPIYGEVRKERIYVPVGQTRIHLDTVEGLGLFLELEVVLQENQTLEEGTAIANALSERLKISEMDRIEGAYLDLIRNQNQKP